VTYRMVEGDSNLFSVDSNTGDVRTLRGLDYEDKINHEIVIGTEEAESLGVKKYRFLSHSFKRCIIAVIEIKIVLVRILRFTSYSMEYCVTLVNSL